MPHPGAGRRGRAGRHRRHADLPLAPRQPGRGRLLPQAVGRHAHGVGRGDLGASLRSHWTSPSRHGLTAEEYDRVIRLPRPGAHLHRARTLLRALVRALRLQALARLPARAADRGAARAPGAGRERGHRGPGRGSRPDLQDREPQSPVVHRAVPGRGDGGGRHPARHLHDGRAPHRGARLPALRGAGGPTDTPAHRGRGLRHQLVRQLLRRVRTSAAR